MWRMGIRAHVQFARSRVALCNHGMADAFRAFAIFQLAMEPDSLLVGKFFLLELELTRQVEQSHLFLFFRDNLVEKSEVITEEDDGGRIVYFGIFSDEVLKENGCHGGDVFMAEAQIGAGKTCIAGLYGGYANLATLIDHVASKDLLGDVHGAFAGFDCRQKDFLLHARNIEWKQAAILNHLAGNIVLTFGEFAQWNFFPGTDLVDQVEVSGRQHAKVLAVLLVDALDIFSNHHLDAGAKFGIGDR